MSKNNNTFIPDAQIAAYGRGFKDGWEAALKSLDNTYVPDTTKQIPVKTLDIQYPDNLTCTVCRMNTSNLTHYVCPQTNCPSRAIWLTYTYGTSV